MRAEHCDIYEGEGESHVASTPTQGTHSYDSH